jgi:hypothetical protein
MEPEVLRILKEHISEQARPQGRQYSLPVIMFLSIIAILMGAKNPIEIYKWMKANAKRKEIKKLLEVEFIRIPGKSRLYDFFEIVDKDELETAFRKWVESIVDMPKDATLAVDGKKLRGSDGKNRDAVNILSAVIAEYGLIVAHKEINNKSNEIPALQELIGELDESFCYEFDALNTQKKL